MYRYFYAKQVTSVYDLWLKIIKINIRQNFHISTLLTTQVIMNAFVYRIRAHREFFLF